MAWLNDHYKCRELGVVSQNSTTMAVIGCASTMPSVYICTMPQCCGKWIEKIWGQEEEVAFFQQTVANFQQ